MAFVAFQAMFAIITVALISGRDRRPRSSSAPGWSSPAIWATVVYFPVAHWVFAFDGVHRRDRRLDRQQAQGDRLRRWHRGAHQRRCRGPGARPGPRQARSASARSPMRPHNLPFVMLGAGLLWFGWFGFNAGFGARRANGTAAVGLRQHDRRHRRGDAGLARSPRRSATATPPPSAPPPASSPAWSPSPRPARRSSPVGAIALGAVAGRAVRPRGRPEVQVRLRRLARRRRRPPGRWPGRHPADRLPRHRRGARRRQRAVLRRRARPARPSGGRGVRGAGLLLRADATSSAWPSHKTIGLPGRRRTTRSRAST